MMCYKHVVLQPYYGTIPERKLELECETVRALVDEVVHLANLNKTVALILTVVHLCLSLLGSVCLVCACCDP